jgi:FkbM family methyltransferase
MISLLAQPWMVRTRNRFRDNPVARSLYLRWMSTFGYEEKFGTALIKAIESDSIVWDIGANVGLYSEKFSQAGARTVVCFEPAPGAIAELTKKFPPTADSQPAVLIMPMALSNQSGTAQMAAAGASPTNKLAAARNSDGDDVESLSVISTVDVTVMRADEAIRELGVPVPNIVKVDVEGFELEVLEGFGAYLAAPELRAVFVEVHFALLHDRGLDNAPELINEMLVAAGFEVRWLDLSHLCGIRNTHKRAQGHGMQ